MGATTAVHGQGVEGAEGVVREVRRGNLPRRLVVACTWAPGRAPLDCCLL